MAGRVAASASLLYARNLFAFLETLIDKETKTLAINPEEELVNATLLTHEGRVVHANFVKADSVPAEAPAPESKPKSTSKKGDA
jgi:H+-translocating NAD(P) transhydrogenase subunit alpha